MIDDLLVGLVGGAVANRLFGRWARRHPRLTYAICIPPLVLAAGFAAYQALGL